MATIPKAPATKAFLANIEMVLIKPADPVLEDGCVRVSERYGDYLETHLGTPMILE